MNSEARRIEGTEDEDHDSFLRRFTLKITPAEQTRLDRSYRMAKYGHRNQFRETGARYFEHLRGAAIIMIDELGIFDVELVEAALLHDIEEDSFLLDLGLIALIFADRVASIVETVTKPKKNDPRFRTRAERNRWYHQQIRNADVDTKLVKLVDRLQNVRALVACSREKQLRKVAETRKYYLPLIADVAKVHPKIAALFTEKFAAAFAKLV